LHDANKCSSNEILINQRATALNSVYQGRIQRGRGVKSTKVILLTTVAQPGGGNLGRLHTPKFSKHCITIFAFAESFKE